MWILALGLGMSSCSDSDSDKPEAKKENAAEEPAPAEPVADSEDGEEDEIEHVGDAPLEAAVNLIEPGEGTPKTLPNRTAGLGPQRVVVEVKITEGRKRKLHVPVVRLAGDLDFGSIDDSGSSYRWTPVATTVLADADDEGVDPEFLAGFESALAVGDAPAPVSLTTDRWDVVSSFAWPAATTDPHVATVAYAQRLALGHLAIPIPELSMSKGAHWEVHRKVDLFGVTTWQSLDCTAKKIAGDQLEITANVSYVGVTDDPISGKPLGLDSVAALSGRGKLRARYDLKTALPIDMQLTAKLDIRREGADRAKRFGFEVRADEDFLARPDERVSLKGKFVQGGLVTGIVPAGTKVWFNRKRIEVSSEGDFVVGFGRDAPPRALMAFAFDGGPDERHVVHVEDREFEPEAIDGLPPEMVDLDRPTRKALGKAKVRIKKVRNKVNKTPYFRDGFEWPMKGKITSTYGRKRILNGEDKGFHWGVDLAAPVGRKVRAPAGGVVIFAEADVPLSGTLLILDHGHGLSSSFLHLDKLSVALGDEVKAGQVIATSGNTGRSTGPHLDWRMNLFDTRVDPQTLVSAAP